MQDLFNDDITQSIAKTVSDVLEGKKPDVSNYVKQNKDGQFEVVDAKGTVLKAFGRKDEAEGFAYKNLSKLQEVEEPRAKGEKEFKKAHVVKKSGEKEDGTVVKEKTKLSEEEVEEDKENGYMNIPLEELSDKQKEYQKVFKAAMKKFDVKSPADFKDDKKKKEFFNYIDKNYKADKESD
tara:strand:+ start:999 stop:1538 length:540 start_codon:yes stop_codon:yes gene_type:complete